MPRRRRHPALLASDTDRDQSVARLRDAMVEGQLTVDEFGDRVDDAHRARTDLELAALTADLTVQPDMRPVRHRAFCSQLVRRGAWEVPRRSSWHAWFGTIVLDLRQARLAGDDVELAIRNVFGTVTVLVPAGITVEVDGGGLFATQVLDPPAWPPRPGAPRVRVRSRGPGTLYVRRSTARRVIEHLIGRGLSRHARGT